MAQFWERFANWLGDHLGCSPCDVGGWAHCPPTRYRGRCLVSEVLLSRLL